MYVYSCISHTLITCEASNMNITILYDYMHKFPLIFMYNYDNFRFLGFSTLERNEKNNKFEYVGDQKQ